MTMYVVRGDIESIFFERCLIEQMNPLHNIVNDIFDVKQFSIISALLMTKF